MKLTLHLFAALFASLTASFALADEAPQCIPDSQVVCIISSYCWTNGNGSWAMYRLATSHQTINEINVDANVPSVCKVGPKLAGPALLKLKAQAQQLKEAGICKTILNNID